MDGKTLKAALPPECHKAVMEAGMDWDKFARVLQILMPILPQLAAIFRDPAKSN